MSVSTHDRTLTSTRIHLGIFGTPALAADILRNAGHPEEQCWHPYVVADPFRELRAGETDVMIIRYSVQDADLAVSGTVADDPRAALLGAHHPLAGRDSVTLDDLADYEAFDTPGVFPADVWDKIVPPFTGTGRPIRRGHRMTTFDRLVEILTDTDCVHLSFSSLHTVAPPEIAVVPISDLPPAPVTLCWLRDADLPEHVTQFITDAEAGYREWQATK